MKYTELVSEIQVIQEVISEANRPTHAPKTDLVPQKCITQADAFVTADKGPLRVLSLDTCQCALGKPGLLGLPTALGMLNSVATSTHIMHILFRYLINAFAHKPQGQTYW